jgi:hypothetical protein
MSTIAFLEQLREDLLDAGWRESLPRGGRVRRGGRRLSGRWLVAAGAVVALMAAGAIGWVVTDGGRTLREQYAAMPRPAASPAPAPAGEGQPTLDQEGFGSLSIPAGEAGGQPAVAVAPIGGVPLDDLSLIVKTARLSVVVARDTFAEPFQDAVDVATANQGYVQTSSSRGGRSGSLVIRVPSSRFEETLRQLKELGIAVEGETVTGEDVTAQHVDLQARLRIARARCTVLLRLMDRATTIEQTLRVQNALDDVQLRIEEIQGALNVLDSRVSEATVQVQIRGTGVEPLEKDVRNPSVPGAFDRAIAGLLRGDRGDRRWTRLPDPRARDRARGVPGGPVRSQTPRLIKPPHLALRSAMSRRRHSLRVSPPRLATIPARYNRSPGARRRCAATARSAAALAA